MPCVNHADIAEGLNPCTRCGQTYCGDCLVELKGGRFCAGCKTEEVKDRQSGLQPGELELASIGQRFAAQFIDGLIFLAIWVPVGFAVGVFAAAASENPDPEKMAAMMFILFGVIFGVGLVYEGAFLTWRGQTLGKMAMKIKVVTPEGEALRGWQAWVRPLVRMVFGIIQYLVLVDYLPAFFTKQKTAIHDMLAKTRVVRLSR